MHTHTLHPDTHAAFLAEQRKDPITGDVLKAGDTVVCCAECGSAFLVDSWEYIGKNHCGQRQTLSAVPENRALVLKKRVEEGALWFDEACLRLEVLNKPVYRPIEASSSNKKLSSLIAAGVGAGMAFIGIAGLFDDLFYSFWAAIITFNVLFSSFKKLFEFDDTSYEREEEYDEQKIQVFENKFSICEGVSRYDFWKNELNGVEVYFPPTEMSFQEKELILRVEEQDGDTFEAKFWVSDYKAFLQALKPWQKSGILQIQSENRYVSAYMAEIGLLPE